MKRRHWMLAGTAAAAAAAGLAWRLNAEGEPAAPTAGGNTEGKGQALDLWSLRFAQPGGGEVVMASLRGQPLLLNFWGSWCPPCIKEMPDLDRFARQHAASGWRVVGLAVDNLQAVRDFLARSPVSYTIGLAGFEGSELARLLGNTQGALPFTVVFNRQGEVVQQKMGPADPEELARWARLV